MYKKNYKKYQNAPTHSINDKIQTELQDITINSIIQQNVRTFQTKTNEEIKNLQNKWRNNVFVQGISAFNNKNKKINLKNYNALPKIDMRNILERNHSKADYETLIENADYEWTIPQKDVDKISKWVDSHYWLAFIPCFSEGLFQMTDKSYLKWTLHRIDIKRNLMELTLTYFSIFQNIEITEFHISTSIIFGEDEDTITILINEKQTLSIIEIIESLNPNTMHNWNAADIAQWNDIKQNSQKTKKEAIAKGYMIAKKTHYNILVENALIYIATTNAIMATSKKTQSSSYKTKHITEDTTISSRPDKYIPKLRTVKIGNLEAHSFNDEIEPVTWSNVEYRTPSWMVRGHIRHLKSGKTCFVHAHEKQRRKVPVDNCPVPEASPNIKLIKGDN